MVILATRPARTLPVPTLPVMAPSATLLTVTGAVGLHPLPVGLQLLPLLRREFGAKRQQEARIGLFQFGARLSHLVDLRQNPGLIGLVLAHQRFHAQLSLIHAGPQIDQLFAVLQKNSIHRLPLIVGQLQIRHYPWIVPPLSMLAIGAERPFKRWAMLSKSRAVAATAWSLCQRQCRSSHENAGNRNCNFK